jgi:glycosyltransferase involved in cell wall biosynthesis
MAMQFWVFSYNRGEFLKNCISSIEFCAPGSRIRIFDDNSNDPATRDALAELAKRHEVVTPDTGENQKNKHGGLYANMQAAFEACEDEDLVCYLQDDMQLVRPISPEEVAQLDAYLSHVETPRFAYPAFLKGVNRNSKDAGFYFAEGPRASVGIYYSDVNLFKVERLRAVNWSFMPKEAGNENLAKSTLGKMAYLRNPFLFYLPNVPSYRGRTQTLALRLAHRMRNCAFYPFQYFSAQENQAFIRRDATNLPYAEDYLKLAPGVDLEKPWIYYPLQGKSWLKQLNSLELKLRLWLN